jgi:hypothetical protein
MIAKTTANRNKKILKAIEEGLAIPYDRDKIKLASLELDSKRIELQGNVNLFRKIRYLTGYTDSEINTVHYNLSL